MTDDSLCACNEFFVEDVVVEDVVVDAAALMRAMMVVMSEPRTIDIVQLPSTETDEVVQTRFLDCSDEAFGERIHAGCARGDLDYSYSSILPEHVEAIGELTVSVSNQ